MYALVRGEGIHESICLRERVTRARTNVRSVSVCGRRCHNFGTHACPGARLLGADHVACGLASDSGDMRITFNMLACCVIDVACMVFDDEAFMCDRWQRPAGPWMESFKCMQRTQLSACNEPCTQGIDRTCGSLVQLRHANMITCCVIDVACMN